MNQKNQQRQALSTQLLGEPNNESNDSQLANAANANTAPQIATAAITHIMNPVPEEKAMPQAMLHTTAKPKMQVAAEDAACHIAAETDAQNTTQYQ